MSQYEEKDKRDIYKVFKRIAEKDMSLFAWYSFDSKILKAELKLVNLRKEKTELHLIPRPGSLPYLQQIISGYCQLKLFVPAEKLYFVSELKLLDEKGNLFLEFPKDYRFDDRRGADRVNPSIPIWVTIEAGNRKLRKECFDIGKGGFSVIVSKTEKNIFKEGAQKYRVVVDWNQEQVAFAAQMVNALALLPFDNEQCPYGGGRMSFKFVDMQKEHKELLESVLSSCQPYRKAL